MAADKLITVEVVYANQQAQRMITIHVREGISIEEAILFSGMLDIFPEIDLQKQKVGIFSELKTLKDPVFDGDRIEIYRSLIIDPKEARRKRVNK